MQTPPTMHFTYETIVVSGELVSTVNEDQQAIQVTSPQGCGLSSVAQTRVLGYTRLLGGAVRNDTAQKRLHVFCIAVQKPERAPGDKNWTAPLPHVLAPRCKHLSLVS